MQDQVTEQLLVLIIDDDADAAEMYGLRLMVDRYSVVVAGDGSEGLRMASEVLPDFIYLDLRMPCLDGFEVLERLRRSPTTRHIPIVILSNYSDQELRDRVKRLGALDFLIKSDTTPARLSSTIRGTTLAATSK